MFEKYLSALRFFRYNPHSTPVISSLFCKMGRHDYEYFETLYDDQGDADGAILECFYCLHRKDSGNSIGDR